ncbi:MAG: D-cysteine desulfhydrase family protein [Treponema sp.]|jgi:D-cysteine desulfhydrase family pyridoxal phosphate-dependent enzyme|nr:D-cysteine desulfhydrase family protein [Treponema sp.]
MFTINEVKALLAKKSRQSLGFYPTPLHKLERLSDELRVNLYLKRDDLSGKSQFGGNKIRKLEYLMGDAKAKGCDVVFTFGATQSNHAMQTVTVCRSCGVEPILYLLSIVKPDDQGPRANLLLDRLLGAEIHVFSKEAGETEAQAAERGYKSALQHAEDLLNKGKKPYVIPPGGADPVGTLGFLGGFAELTGQFQSMGGEPVDYIFHATGTGGTLAGLAAGRLLLNSNAKIISIAVGPPDPGYETAISALANQSLELLAVPDRLSPSDLRVDRNYYGPGYEIPSDAGNDAIRRLARTEGILADTVYSGKGFAGLLDYIKSGKIPQGSNVVFWHTGGVTALFAEQEIISGLLL